MKKTTTINLSGLVFHIEEDGYQILFHYFEDLKRIFSKEQGGDEILSDIESRFAELFNAKLNKHKEVITLEEVNEVIAIMGSSNQFEEEQNEHSEKSEDSQNTDGIDKEQQFGKTEKKRLYRDTEDGILGGVAAGTAHYFNIDPLIIRILWIVFVLVGGSGLLIYIIAWMLIPEAKTTAEKLNMHGQDINVDTIKSFAENVGNEAKKGINKVSDSIKRSETLKNILNFIVKTAGFFILFLGIISVITLIISFILNYLEINLSNFDFIIDSDFIFDDFFFEKHFSFIILFILSVIPIIFIVILGLKLIFGKRIKTKRTSIFLFILWIVSFTALTYFAIKTGIENDKKPENKEEFYFEKPAPNLSPHLFDDDNEITDENLKEL